MPFNICVTVLTEGFLAKADLLRETVNASIDKGANHKSHDKYETVDSDHCRHDEISWSKIL
jgi:hypothetical protein